MKNKKGFTLIELLAVIVILAIIALIATPIILNMINNARKKAAESSAYGFVEAIEYNNGLADMSGDMDLAYTKVTGNDLDVTTINVKLKGKKPTSGTVSIDDSGKVTEGDFCIEGYQVAYRGKEVTEVKKGCGSSSSENSAQNNPKYICERATELHTVTCGYAQCSATIGYGNPVSYGNLKTSGLKSGDAFNCDVDGDGTADPETERFYYVGDANSSTASLVYYKNIDDSSLYGSLQDGPTEAIKKLPTTSEWKNVSLSNTTRTIKDELGNPVVNNFSYEGYSARLLTIQEIEQACNMTVGNNTPNELNNCMYLVENTMFVDSSLPTYYWLENEYSTETDTASIIVGPNLSVGKGYLNSPIGIRPVIEVAKTDMEI